MINGIIDFLLAVWGHLPVLALTDETIFANVSATKIKDGHLRISIFNLLFGRFAIQICSWPIINTENRKFQFVYKQRIDNQPDYSLTDEKLQQLKENYWKHMDSLANNGDDLLIEREALRNQLQISESRIQGSISKTNIYMTIVLAVIPLLLTRVDWKGLFYTKAHILFVVLLLGYSVLNLLLFIFEGLKVRGQFRSKFQDLKNSEKKAKQLNWSYYFDWQHSKRSADMLVSYTWNCQEWIIGILILSVILSIMVSYSKGTNYQDKGIQKDYVDNVITIDTSQLNEVYGQDIAKMHQLQSAIADHQISSVFILYGSEKSCDVVKQYFSVYGKLNKRFLYDADIKEGTIKIIMEQ